jgi:hypothetical protein
MPTDDKDEKKPKDEGGKEYIEKVILNPNLEKDLQESGSGYHIPTTPVPESLKKDNTNDKKQCVSVRIGLGRLLLRPIRFLGL